MLFFFLIVHSALSRGPPSFTKAESGQSYATHLPSKQATTECKESGMIVLTSFYFEFYSVFILEHQFSSVAQSRPALCSAVDCSMRGLLGGSVGEESTYLMQETQETLVQPLVGKVHWRRRWQPTPVSLPGKSHRQKSMEADGPWGCKSWT